MNVLTAAYIADRKGEFDYSDILLEGELSSIFSTAQLIYVYKTNTEAHLALANEF